MDLPLQVGTRYTSSVKLPFPIVTGRLSSADYGLAYNFNADTNEVLVILAANCGPQTHKQDWKTLIPTGRFTELSLSENNRVWACVLPLPNFLCLFIPVRWTPDKEFFVCSLHVHLISHPVFRFPGVKINTLLRRRPPWSLT